MNLKSFRARPGGPVGIIPNVGILDPNTTITATSKEHQAAIIATNLYDEVPAEPAPTVAPADETPTPTPDTGKGGKK